MEVGGVATLNGCAPICNELFKPSTSTAFGNFHRLLGVRDGVPVVDVAGVLC